MKFGPTDWILCYIKTYIRFRLVSVGIVCAMQAEYVNSVRLSRAVEYTQERTETDGEV